MKLESFDPELRKSKKPAHSPKGTAQPAEAGPQTAPAAH
jgi:hypothetical protein